MPGWLLSLSVFTAGMTTLGIEITASRLLGSVFGTSNIVWANIIGLILVYLSVGYFIGGRLADRYPDGTNYLRLLTWASFASGLVPILARPVLLRAASAVENLNAAVMLGSFGAVLILFSVPVTLLGCVSPYAIRLAITDATQAGRISGRMYAISTFGSILGTFLPVLLLIPWIGTRLTFLVFSLALMLIALIGLTLARPSQALRYAWMPILLLILYWWLAFRPLKDTEGQIIEAESSYNYIQVVEREGTRYLLLNEGQGIHSVYNPKQDATFGTWDYFLAAPFFNDAPISLASVKRLGLVGLAGGTIAKQYSKVFGPVPIDGWEIDPQIVEIGRQYFAMNEPNLNPIIADGRWGLTHSGNVYSVIGVDAYRLPYIPWHLTTREFFQEVHDHLTPDGVLVINVGRTMDDRRLIHAMVGTLDAVFQSVHVVDVPSTFNTIIYATRDETRAENLLANFTTLSQEGAPELLLDVLERTFLHLQPTPQSDVVFTDDRAPIERLTDSITIRFVLGGNVAHLQEQPAVSP